MITGSVKTAYFELKEVHDLSSVGRYSIIKMFDLISCSEITESYASGAYMSGYVPNSILQ